MQLIINSSGIDSLRERIELARQTLPKLIQRAALQAGEEVKSALSDAAPKGKGSGTPPAGDASGPLSGSFYLQGGGGDGSSISVRTLQPQKLEYVVRGTGIYGSRGMRIVPTVKRALYWDGADHPYRSVAGQKPNDFVTPALASAPTADVTLQDVVISELSSILQGV